MSYIQHFIIYFKTIRPGEITVNVPPVVLTRGFNPCLVRRQESQVIGFSSSAHCREPPLPRFSQPKCQRGLRVPGTARTLTTKSPRWPQTPPGLHSHLCQSLLSQYSVNWVDDISVVLQFSVLIIQSKGGSRALIYQRFDWIIGRYRDAVPLSDIPAVRYSILPNNSLHINYMRR